MNPIETNLNDVPMRRKRRRQIIQRCQWYLSSLILIALSIFQTNWTLQAVEAFSPAQRIQPSFPAVRKNGQQLYAASSGSEPEKISSSPSQPIIGVTLKIALDASGGVAELDSEESERFTSPESLDMVHRLRRDCDAVLVGRGTVQADNPSLTIRRVQPLKDPLDGETSLQPLRVVLDPKFSLALEQFASERNYQIFDDGYPTVVYHTIEDVDYETLAFLETVQFVRLPRVTREHNERIAPSPAASTAEVGGGGGSEVMLSVINVMSDLSQRYHIRHLMVEGGPTTAQSFLRAGVVDRAIVVKAPVRFRQPLQSGITSQLLQEAGLQLLGTYESDADVIECWSRPQLPWPTENIQDWP